MKPVAILRAFSGIFAVAILLGLFSNTAFAETVTQRIELTREQITVNQVGALTSVDVADKHYTRLQEEGSPALPYRIVNILLPQGTRVQSWTHSMSAPHLLATGVSIELAPPMVSENGKPGEAPPMASYSIGGTEFPATSVRYLGTGYMHGRGIASFAVFPLRLEDGTLQYNEFVDISVDTEPVLPSQKIITRERYREGFDQELEHTLSSIVDNPAMNDRYVDNTVRVENPGRSAFMPTPYPSLEGSPVDYLIITTDDLANDFQRLADFKTTKGVPTVVRTLSFIQANSKHGSDIQETMRFFIRDAYAKWGIRYLLLGGDTDILPDRRCFSTFYLGGFELPVDLYFTGLDGTWNDDHDAVWGEGFNVTPVDNPDLYPEVYEGRLPISTSADVIALIDKVISYESADHPEYMDKHLMLAEVLFPVGWTAPDPWSLNGSQFIEYLMTTSMQGTAMNVVRMYETPSEHPSAVQESRAAALDSLEAGYNFVTHIGHGFRFNMSVGNASILNVDADALTNNGTWFNLYMLNCTAAAYDFFCLAEHFLENYNGGAVSVIGANESAFPNAASNYMNEYHNLVFSQDVVHIGEAFSRSRLPRTPIALAGDNVDLWTHYIYSILADPEMPFFNGPVDTFTVFHPGNVGLGTTNILVNVTDGGLPVDSAVVCMTKGEDDYKVGATNSLGNAVLEFTTESPGSILVVVTGLNHGRHESYITVDPSANAYVKYGSVTIDDDATGGTVGNGDGIIDAGETIDLTITMENTGTMPSDSVWFELNCNDPGVTVTDSISAVGVIAAGGMAVALDPVRIQLSSGIADETVIELLLDIQESGGALRAGAPVLAGGPFADSFKKEVHAPELAMVMERVDDDPPLGDGNGVLANLEEFKLYYKIKNFGTGTANGVTAEVADLDDGFIFTDSTDTYPDLAPYDEGENVSGFHMQEINSLLEDHLEITITDGYGRTFVDTVELRFPLPPIGLTFNSSLGPDKLKVSWDLSLSSDAARYNLYHSLTQGGPYDLVNVDPVEHGLFVDTGLDPITRYYYVVTALDESGNESVPSVEASASTNPPQMAGFPILLDNQTTSDPVIGDIDGDGDNEIVVGSSHVAAWHHTGLELKDGDSDPQTWGILNTLGGEITSSIALGNLDNVPGLDIVACDLDSNWVMCMNYNGDMLPGWPKVAEHDFRAPPTTGDIDGDGFTDVIAVDTYGVIYAWDRLGNEIVDGDANPATDGVLFRATPISFSSQGVALDDFDSDGNNEIVYAGRDGIVHVLNDDGTEVAGWPFAMPSEAVGSPAVGDIDNDGLPEVLVRSRSTEVYLLNHDGTSWGLGWPRYISLNEPFFGPSFALADFDNDNDLEIVVCHQNTIESRLYVIQHNGNNMPGWPIVYNPNDNTESSPVVADVNGDGNLDIMLGDESRFIYAWDINGNMVDGFPIATEDAVRATPTLGDVDGDGDIDMVVYSWDQRVYLYDLGGPYNPALSPWSMLQGNFMRDGRYGSKIPTGVGGITFNFAVSRNGINLTWLLPEPGGERFNILRSVSNMDGEPQGAFEMLAEDVAADPSGLLEFEDGGVTMGEHYVYRLESVDNPGSDFQSSAIYVPITRADLAQNYPNPFNPTTSISYFVPENGPKQQVSIIVYDVSGARVRTLVNEQKKPGRFAVEWDGKDDRGMSVGSGVYFYKMKTEGFSASKKMVFLK